MTILACQNARFVGANVPHIDPLKEVKAIREMLGNENMPLITNEQAVEFLTEGDWYTNITKYKEELKFANIESKNKSKKDGKED